MADSRKSSAKPAWAASTVWAVRAVLGAAALGLAALFYWAISGGSDGRLRSFLRGGPAGDAPGAASGAETGLSLPDLLGDGNGDAADGSATGFRKILGPRPLRFPDDHGPHPEYRSEWWYFTGNLQDTLGREFGYQLTFFRSGLRPPGADSADSAVSASGGRVSPWTAGDAYMAHFALTDAGAGAFEAHERFSRAALGLAGAEAGSGKPFRVWLEDWSAAAVEGDPAADGHLDPGRGESVDAAPVAPATGSGDSRESGFLPLRLRAAQGAIAIDLLLRPGKARVLQGDSGYSRKGPESGNASLYYSYTRLATEGRIRSAQGEFKVSGTTWLDREWGSSLLSPGLAGWEWFGLRLADSTDWTFFRLRKSGAEAAAEDSVAFDYGLRVDAGGRTRRFGPGEVSGRILSRWAGKGGAAYPARWRLGIPADSLEMEISPVAAGQELRLSIPYWEGAVQVRAVRQGRMIAGRGYMELTGY